MYTENIFHCLINILIKVYKSHRLKSCLLTESNQRSFSGLMQYRQAPIIPVKDCGQMSRLGEAGHASCRPMYSQMTVRIHSQCTIEHSLPDCHQDMSQPVLSSPQLAAGDSVVPLVQPYTPACVMGGGFNQHLACNETAQLIHFLQAYTHGLNQCTENSCTCSFVKLY